MAVARKRLNAFPAISVSTSTLESVAPAPAPTLGRNYFSRPSAAPSPEVKAPAAVGLRPAALEPVIEPPRRSSLRLASERNTVTTPRRSLNRDQVARNLLLARQVLHITQETLAHKAGIARATIAQLESAQADTRLGTLVDLAQVLGTSPSLLLFSDQEITALAQTIDRGAIDRILTRVPPASIEQMWALKNTQLPKNLHKVARLGAEIIRFAGLDDPSAKIGAGIGSVIQPGLGTAVGAIYGTWLSPARHISPDTVEQGGGI
jgi:transcriptional regulator with XRE-family HTH domain